MLVARVLPQTGDRCEPLCALRQRASKRVHRVLLGAALRRHGLRRVTHGFFNFFFFF
jgi:hypothetical protein